MTLTKAMRALGATTLAGALLLTAAPLATADQVRDGQWVNTYYDVSKVWSVSKGDGVIVAVLDEGVDASHPDLAGQVLPGFDLSGKGLAQKPADSHGTGMAAEIAGHGHGNGEGVVGLAPGAKILPIYKQDSQGRSVFPQGIRWAVDHGAKIINVSQGGYVPAGSEPALTEALAYAAQRDVLVVASAGNDGRNVLHNPANEAGVLAVGATDKSDAAWSKSNYGPQVLLSAPGVRMVTAGDCSGGLYCVADGTSDSTAYVSAAAALIRAKFPQLTAGQVANRLVKSAKVPGALQGAKLPDPHYGYGILRPYEALTMDIPAGSAQGPLAKSAGSTASAGAATPSGAGQNSDLPTLPGAAPGSKSGSSGGISPGTIVMGIVLLLVVLIAIVVVATKNRRRPPAPPAPPYGQPQQPPYGAAPGWPPAQQQPYGNQAPPPGYPPQNPQQPQPNPYQNPYGQGGNQQQR
ncbi:S8 family serine peptidase [Kitasatospora sp. NPDC048365]|uniref:S8 family serine peptidase n=1 Tax=Kitasatospora sp. NPDC048365 TaxID=3364050 RepID=UPI0037227ED4